MSTIGHDPVWDFIRLDDWRVDGYYTYVRLAAGASSVAVTEQMDRVVAAHGTVEYGDRLRDNGGVILQGVADIHLQHEGDSRRSFLYLLSAVAAFVLLIACVNSINLATARAIRRAKELTGLINGIYPAVVLSDYQPVRVLRGTLRSGRGGTFLRRRLVEFQFGISIFLIIATVIVYRQLEFLRTADLEFDREHVLVLRTGYEGVHEHAEAIKRSFSAVGCRGCSASG